MTARHPAWLLLAALFLAPPAYSQSADYAALLAAAEASAAAAAAELEDLNQALQKPLQSDEQVTERFVRLNAMLDTIEAGIGPKSDNRVLVDRLIQETEAEQKRLLERAEKSLDNEFREYARRWGVVKERLVAVREGLLAEADQSQSLRTQLTTAEEKVRQELKLSGAEAAAQKLEEVRAKLGAMNDSLRALVDNARQLQEPVPGT